MGFHQTASHRSGKHSFHQIGLVRGQFGDVPEDKWLDFAHCWNHWFLFAPLPPSIGGYSIPDARVVSLELLIERFKPVADACKKYGVDPR